LDLGAYLRDVCHDLEESMPGCKINVGAEDGIEVATDRAIPAALLVNELITNAAKYAYPAGPCRAWVKLSRGPQDTLVLSVRDQGVGVPSDFDIKSNRRLGMRLVNAFTVQLQADLQFRRLEPGTEFLLSIPVRPRS
jgi:two-component sensor histidine kinase